jgi:hypothetical protein
MALIIAHEVSITNPVKYSGKMYSNYGMADNGYLYKRDNLSLWSIVEIQSKDVDSKSKTSVLLDGQNRSLSKIIAETLLKSESESKMMVENLNHHVASTYVNKVSVKEGMSC